MCNMLSNSATISLCVSDALTLSHSSASVTVASVDVLFSHRGLSLFKRPTLLPLCCHLPVIHLGSTVGADAARKLSP